jgi:hypothetical protein
MAGTVDMPGCAIIEARTKQHAGLCVSRALTHLCLALPVLPVSRCSDGHVEFELGSKRMVKLGLIMGLATSLALIFLAYTAKPEASGAEVQTGAAPSKGCVTREVALDEGYGVTRFDTRIVCATEK